MKLCVERWVEPHVDTSSWEYFDLSCKSRDETKDKARGIRQTYARWPVNGV